MIVSRPMYNQFCNYVRNVQKPLGNYKIFCKTSGFIIVRFALDEDCARIIKSGPFTFNSRITIMKIWKPGWKLARDYFSSIPIWVKLEDLNLHFWNRDVISRIASTIERPVKMDTTTTAENRLHYARVLVEV